MRRVVLDAAAFVAWFGSDPEAGSLRAEYEAGDLGLVVPTSFTHHVLGHLARQGWAPDRIARLAGLVDKLGVEKRDPSPITLARWLVRGLDPSLAAYAALAEESERPLIAADPTLRRVAASLVGR